MSLKIKIFYFPLLVWLLCSCRVDRSIMFKTEGQSYSKMVAGAEGNYKILPDDYLNVFVYTNKGERIIDPNQEFARTSQAGGDKSQSEELNPRLLVKRNGMVNLPMVGEVYLKDFTLSQADSILQIEYSKFYEDVFVITRLINKRVTVLGPQGGKIIPLVNENMNLIEVIALYGGITETGKATNIRLIRGNPNDPQVEVIDLSTIGGMKKATLRIEANDIVYIEPQRRLISETLRDVGAIVGILSSIITVTYLGSRIFQ